MAKRKKGGGGANAGHQSQIAGVNQGFQNWNDLFGGWSGDAIDWGQQNPFSQAGQSYIEQTLSGNTPNRWMDMLYGDLEGVNLNESFDYLRDFLGGPPGSGGGGAGSGRGGGAARRSFSGSARPAVSAPNVNIPDSSAGPGAFRDTAEWFLDRDARLNPEDDPTLKPYIDALQQDAEESFLRSQGELAAGMSGNNMWGGSKYDALLGFARDDFNENMQGTLSGVYQGSRNNAIQSMKDILGLANQRDIAEGNIDAELAAASMAANASLSGSSAAAESAANAQRLQAIGMLLGGNQFGMGMKGDMANLLQQGQLGALQAGGMYGELGLGGYDRAANFGQLGLGALGSLGNNINSYWNSVYGNQARQDQLRFQRERYEHDQPWVDANRMIDLMRGLGDLSGDYDYPGFVPQPIDNTTDPWMDALLAGGGYGFGSYFNERGRR